MSTGLFAVVAVLASTTVVVVAGDSGGTADVIAVDGSLAPVEQEATARVTTISPILARAIKKPYRPARPRSPDS